jgi:hypothetical protein
LKFGPGKPRDTHARHVVVENDKCRPCQIFARISFAERGRYAIARRSAKRDKC